MTPDGFLAAFPARDLLAFGNASAAVISELNEFLERANHDLARLCTKNHVNPGNHVNPVKLTVRAQARNIIFTGLQD